MASIRFCGREVHFGSGNTEDRQRDSQQGHVLAEMVDAALPETIARQRQLQQLRAAQAKQIRDEERAIARQFNVEVKG
jgi:hypothetical protein